MIATLLRFVSARLVSLLAGVVVLAVLVAVGCGGSSDAASGVAVFPAHGTPTASPKTQISFRGEAPSELTGIKVKGSSSGTHGGKLKAHSDGDGASFIPNKDFKPGETVTVDADLDLLGDDGKVKFKIGRRARIGVPKEIRADPGGTPEGSQKFRSRPGLRPLTLKVTQKGERASNSNIFVALKAGAGQDGPTIFDQNGRVVYFKRVPKFKSAFDFRVQQYKGEPVLTYWEGGVYHGQGDGEGVIMNNAYKEIERVHAGNGYKMDFHEFTLSRDNTALILIYQPIEADLRKVGGSKRGSVLEGIVQEIDIPTGLVMYEWHSLGNISPKESYTKVSSEHPYDITHLNSIFEEENGNLLVSARETHAALELDRKSGKVKWRLGGRKSDYKMSGGSQFIAQHHISRLDNGRLTVFDNGSPPSPGRPARGLALNVNEDEEKVTVARSVKRSKNALSPSQGSMQGLPNGNYMVGWGGDSPYVSEFTSGGKRVFDAHFIPPTVDTYRAWRFPWVGKPTSKPDIFAQVGGGQTGVYASWNGATEVDQWEVLAGPTAATLLPREKADRKGFETRIVIDGTHDYVAVRALDGDGNVLGTSKTVQPKG